MMQTAWCRNICGPESDLTDMNLAFEDANSKLLYVVSVADFDAEECVDVWSRFWSWGLEAILNLNICQEKILNVMFC